MLNEQIVKDKLKNAIGKIIGENVNQMPSDDVLLEISKEFTTTLNEARQTGRDEAITEMNTKFIKAADKQDEDYAEKLKSIVEGYENAIGRLDSIVTTRFNKLNESYKAKLANPEISDILVERLSTFIDSTIEELIPEHKVIDEIKFERLNKFYESVRKSVIVSNDELQSIVSRRLADVDGTVKSLREQLNEALATKIQLIESNNKFKTEKLINESLEKVDTNVAEVVRTKLKDKNFSEVQQMIDECITSTTDELITERRRLADEQKKKKVIKPATLIEHVEPTLPDVTDAYANMYERIIGK